MTQTNRCATAVQSARERPAYGEPAGTGVFVPELQAWARGEVHVKAPGSESAVEIAARVRAVLDDLADRHRGEAVLVVTHGGAIVATQAVLDLRPGLSWEVPNCSWVELDGDADGWRLR